MTLAFPVAVGALAALTAGGIAVAFVLHLPQYAWVVVPIVGVLAVLYLYRYSQLPGPESEPPVEGGDEEPFVDPVEEADRAALPPESASAEPPDAEPFDDPVEAADKADTSPGSAPPPAAGENP